MAVTTPTLDRLVTMRLDPKGEPVYEIPVSEQEWKEVWRLSCRYGKGFSSDKAGTVFACRTKNRSQYHDRDYDVYSPVLDLVADLLRNIEPPLGGRFIPWGSRIYQAKTKRIFAYLLLPND
jgi:hypothetical protein